MFTISDSVPYFSLYDKEENPVAYCNPQNYLGYDNPIEIFYQFDPKNAGEIDYYNAPEEARNKRTLVAEEYYNSIADPQLLQYISDTIGDDIVKKTAFFISRLLMKPVNDVFYQQIEKFLDEIESVANVKFTYSEALQPNRINLAFADIEGDQLLLDSEDVSTIAVKSKDKIFLGAVLYVRDTHSDYKKQTLKDIKFTILQALCEDRPHFNNLKDEVNYRSLVEDFSTSFAIHKACRAMNPEIITNCASKHGVNLNEPLSGNHMSFERCLNYNLDKKCLHIPDKLSLIDVQLLQKTFGPSRAKVSSKFLDKFKEQYGDYIIEKSFAKDL